MGPAKLKGKRTQPHNKLTHEPINPALIYQEWQPIPAQTSDYDTDQIYTSDAANSHLFQNGQLYQDQSSMHHRSTSTLNLSVLRRYNPTIQSIVAIAPYAVLYTFSHTTQKWEKCNVEGSLFICKLVQDPTFPTGQRFAAIILNRRGLENFAAYLDTSQSVEVTDEYIILQVSEDTSPNASTDNATSGLTQSETQIYGLWIFSEAGSSTAGMRAHIAQVMVECAALAEASSIDATGHIPVPQGVVQPIDYDGRIAESTGNVPSTGIPVTTGRQVSLQELFGK